MPSESIKFALRSSVMLGSLLTGASIMHQVLKPDMTLPSLEGDAREGTSSKPRSEPVVGFVAVERFGGARPGMVFRMGSAGLGYYPDGSRPPS